MDSQKLLPGSLKSYTRGIPSRVSLPQALLRWPRELNFRKHMQIKNTSSSVWQQVLQMLTTQPKKEFYLVVLWGIAARVFFYLQQVELSRPLYSSHTVLFSSHWIYARLSQCYYVESWWWFLGNQVSGAPQNVHAAVISGLNNVIIMFSYVSERTSSFVLMQYCANILLRT